MLHFKVESRFPVDKKPFTGRKKTHTHTHKVKLVLLLLDKFMWVKLVSTIQLYTLDKDIYFNFKTFLLITLIKKKIITYVSRSAVPRTHTF